RDGRENRCARRRSCAGRGPPHVARGPPLPSRRAPVPPKEKRREDASSITLLRVVGRTGPCERLPVTSCQLPVASCGLRVAVSRIFASTSCELLPDEAVRGHFDDPRLWAWDVYKATMSSTFPA